MIPTNEGTHGFKASELTSGAINSCYELLMPQQLLLLPLLLLLLLLLPLLDMGVSANRGPQYSTPNSRILIIRTPKKVPLIFGNSHIPVGALDAEP